MKVEAGGSLHCKYNFWVQSYIKEQSDKNGKWFGVDESFTTYNFGNIKDYLFLTLCTLIILQKKRVRGEITKCIILPNSVYLSIFK